MQLVDRTQPDAAEQVLIQSEDEATRALETLRLATINAFQRFWNGPVPTADLLAKLGTRAAASFQAHAAAVQFLLSQGVELAPPDYTPPVAYTAHQDGTITLD